MLLIGLAITVAFVSSWGASLGVQPHILDFWWELALVIVIMLLGHWIKMGGMGGGLKITRTGSPLTASAG
jgi:P-type Cu2+ transporter